jgi:uncharacterized protein (TIGR02099 family)
LAITQHKFRSKLITTLAVMVILFAMVFSLFRLIAPYATDYVESIEAELTQQLGMRVQIGMVDADIAWLVPRLKLLDVDLYDTKTSRLVLHFNEINLSISWLKSIKNLQLELDSISLVGLDINIQRDKKGNFTVQGFNIGGNKQGAGEFVIPAELNALLENSSVYLVDSVLRWTDQLNNNQQLIFNNVNLALINNAPEHKISINMSLPSAYGEHVEIMVDINGPLIEPLSWNGRVFVGVKKLRLKRWFDDYWQRIEFTGTGELNANVWIELREQSLVEINAELSASQLALHYLDEDVRSWTLDFIAGKLRWQQRKQGWKLDIRELEVMRDKLPWPVTSELAVTMDQQQNTLAVEVNFLRIEDLTYLADLGAQFMPLNDFGWSAMLASYHPHGDLYDISVNASLDAITQSRASVRFVDLSLRSSTSLPSIKGLDGRLIYDAKGAVLQLDSSHVVVDFNDLFRNTLLLTSVRGDVGIYGDLSGWRIQTDLVSVNTPHFSSMTRFKLEVPIDKPAHMDMVSHFKNVAGAYKSLYLPAKVMSADLVSWLDNALVELEMPAAGAVFRGRFKDFPFAQGEGVFEVLFDVENATLQYMPDWPAIKNMQAEVRFYNQSLSLRHAKGAVFDSWFDNTQIDIVDFDQTHVSVDGRLHGSLQDILNFVEQSPLTEVLGSYITSFEVEGDTELKLNLQIPIVTDDPVQVNGRLLFKGNSVYLPAEKYHFKDFNGQLKFTENGAWAQKLSARLDTYPLEMSVSPSSKNNKAVTHLAVQGYLPVDSLLSPLESIKPYMHGATDWKVDIYAPSSAHDKTTPIDIFVASNLKGIASTMPGPFAKLAAEQAPFKLHLAVLSDGLTTQINYSTDFTLAANLNNGLWRTNINTRSVQGRATFMADFSVDKVASIDLEYIDISAFEAEDGAPGLSIQGGDFPPLKIYIQKLDWQNKTFTDVNIYTHRVKAGMIIDHIELHVPGISAMGKGSWSSSWRHKNITSLDLGLDINNLGLGLSQLNISTSIKDSRGQATLAWQWNAEPYAFDWELLQGEAMFELEEGGFTDIEVGAGRLLGVLNFETIFTLDFRNQVADGFSFDAMNASLRFSDGHVFTDDFAIESKVANIEIHGRVGMSGRDYDLQVEVVPKVSNAFTVIGVATGGPILGLGVHFFQRLFGVDEAAASRSTITGTWAAPIITEAGGFKAGTGSTESDFSDENEVDDGL